MMNWTCSACGFTNAGDACRRCGGAPPDYGRHFQVLNLAAGPVFNGPVQVNVDPGNTEEVLTKWFGDPEEESIQETIRNKPTSLDQVIGMFIKLMFWFFSALAVLAIMTIAFVLLAAMFGL